MKNLWILTGMIALASMFGFAGAVTAGGPNSQLAVTATIIDFDVGGGASCADEQENGQCDGSEAFITKNGSWGVRIQGVVLANPLDELRVCLTGETRSWGGFAEPLVSGLTPRGAKNTVSAGGDVFADTGFEENIGLPGFGILSCPLGVCDEVAYCGGGTNILEFETGIPFN